MRSPGGERRMEIFGLAGALADRIRVGLAKVGQVALDPRQHDVAVVELAENLLQVAGPLRATSPVRPKQNSVASST